jgi:hypothetical protein
VLDEGITSGQGETAHVDFTLAPAEIGTGGARRFVSDQTFPGGLLLTAFTTTLRLAKSALRFQRPAALVPFSET